MSQISYAEVETLLGVKNTTIAQAVGRGVFTRLPRDGKYQPLIREQVELFVGKHWLSLRSLNEQEKRMWQAYADSATQAIQTVQFVQPHIDADDSSMSLEHAATEIMRSVASVGSEAIRLLSENRYNTSNPFLSPVAG